MSDAVKNWIADGQQAAEPVTTETPAAAEVSVSTDTPVIAAEPVIDATGRAHGSDGTFVPKPSESAAATGLPANPTVQQVQDFIEAQHGDAAFQIPKGVKIPLKRGETIEYKTIEELQREGMREADYRQKTMKHGEDRRALEAQQTAFRAQEAKVQAREAWLAEREAEMVEAQKDPKAWESYQQMRAMYQASPQFRKLMDDALAKRETDAENEVYRRAEDQRVIDRGKDMSLGWIDEIGKESQFTAVNPERVRELYAQALVSGQAELSPDAIRRIYQQEASYLAQSAGPLQNELANLKAQVAALTARQAAEKHNATTQHAVARSKTPSLATTGNAPAPVAGGPVKPFGIRELPDRNAEWSRQR